MAEAPSSYAKVADVEWKFGVTAMTDEQAVCGSTFLQMKMVLDDEQGGRREELLEMDMPTFYKLFSTLTKAKAALTSGEGAQ